MATTLCALGCGRDVNTDSLQVCRKTTGWAPQRGATGGANMVYLPERHQAWAHLECVKLESRGISVRQESLLS